MHSLNRRLRAVSILCVAFALAFVVALRIVMTQRKTLAELRAEPIPPSPITTSEPIETSRRVEAQPVEISGLPTSSASYPAVIALPAQEPGATNTELPALRAENGRLGTQLREVEAELAQAKRLVPEPENPKDAYVGPGMWVNADGQTHGITKIVILGEALRQSQFSTMSIKLWGRCVPRDCELEEVPFFLLDLRAEGNRSYRRGFAAWDFENGDRRYLIVTFEKTGLKVESITIAAQRGVPPWRTVEKMTRIN